MKKRKQNRFETFLSILIVIVMLPLLITVFCQQMESQRLLGTLETETISTTTNVEDTGNIDNEALLSAMDQEQTEALLTGIVAKEISLDAPEEAVKAQCVIARTNLLLARESGHPDPTGFSVSEMKEVLGEEQFPTHYEALKKIIEQTKNQVLTWNGDYIDAEYHAISAGSTRSIQEEAPQANLPYLCQVTCKADMSADGYLGVHYWEKSDFFKKCKEYFPDAGWVDEAELALASSKTEGESMQSQGNGNVFFVKTKDSAGYVLTMQLAQSEVNGDDFRKAFQLNSSNFSVEEEDGKVRIVTKGLGHGYGMSQNMAIEMAKDGNSYKDILSYFFPETELTDCIK